MNDMISRLTGKGGKRKIGEDVPVPCATGTTVSYRDRLNRLRKRRDPDGIEDEAEHDVSEDQGGGMVARILGEANEDDEIPSSGKMDGIFPEEVEDLDTGNSTLATPLRPVKNVVQEPSHPTGEKEKLLTPYAALTAPDVTPSSFEPIDPSSVPGMEPADSFKAVDLDTEGVMPDATPDKPKVNAMDVLLGRTRKQPGASAGPMSTPPTNEEPAPVMTEAAAQRLFSKTAVAATPGAALQQGVPMPTPEISDGRRVMEAFRRVMK